MIAVFKKNCDDAVIFEADWDWMSGCDCLLPGTC